MKKAILAIIMTFCLVTVVYADIEISGHVVTVWSDAQYDELTARGTSAGVPLALTMGSGPQVIENNPLSSGVYQLNSTAAAAADVLAVAEIELDIDADITDNISARIDLEAAENLGPDVEAAYIKLVQPFDVPFDVIVGKFVAPVGVEPQEQIDRKLITNSLPDKFLPNTLTGIAVTGTVSAIDYVIFYVNDLDAGDNDRNEVTDGSNAIGARLATSPLEGLDIGIAYAVESLNDVTNLNPTDVDFRVLDVDAVYANGPWEIRGEYLAASEDDSAPEIVYVGGFNTNGDQDVDAYSIQVSYDVDEQINVVARYANEEPNQANARRTNNNLGATRTALGNEYTVVSVGASYAFSENAIFKIEYSDIDTEEATGVPVYDPDDNLIACELTVAF
ncbi:MAG: porin [Candidatus Hydrogenedentota bacterium]